VRIFGARCAASGILERCNSPTACFGSLLVNERSKFTWRFALPLVACMERCAVRDEPIGLAYTWRINLT
jgi:hypothetical protein